MTLGFKLAASGAILLAMLSAYPGLLGDLIFVGLLLWPLVLPILGLGGLVAFLLHARSVGDAAEPVPPIAEARSRRHAASRKRWIVLSPIIVLLSLAAVRAGTPRQLAFRASRPAFQRLVVAAPIAKSAMELREGMGGRLGIYYVDNYAADPRGGVYFRTFAGSDGLGPDVESHGFAYRPNPEGTPFGQAGYEYTRIDGDWYVFSTSDD